MAALREISHHTPSKEGTLAKSSEHRTGGVKEPSSDKIIQYIREKFGVPGSTAVILDPFHSSPDPEFLDTIVSVDDGKSTAASKKSSEISVSKNGHYLVMGFLAVGGASPSSIVPLGSGGVNDIPRGVQEAFRLAPSITVSKGLIRTSPFPNFFVTTITADNAGKKSTLDAYVTLDHKFLVLGNIYDLSVDPRMKALHTLILQNQPETGPRNAPVTIVEFADLECPTCARAHELLEKTILPTYAGKVRVIFKEFPIQYHEFAMPAAIADQCAYRINPADYLPYRTLIFQHQGEFEAIKANASAVRDLLLNLGQQAGINNVELAGCMDSKASLPRIEANLKEAKALDVNSTPTFFINGRTMIGAAPDIFTQAIEEALLDSRKKK
ncbi:MAG TPA: thioredoxin domain-containing protein [Terriglobia bacterium]|nr:thioredoxin domain-containing protein [Terriglobia bacterium]